jgi:hypothetical protein
MIMLIVNDVNNHIVERLLTSPVDQAIVKVVGRSGGNANC